MVIGVVVGIFVMFAPPASALDRYVPGGYNTIQAAIKASGNGDTVYVNPGTYTECITIDGKYVSLRAVNGDPNATLLTGCAGRSIIMVQNVPYREGVPRVTISGFRIANGSSPEGQGGGITIFNNADPLITNNYFVGNHAGVDGGALLARTHSNPAIINNLFQDNWAARLGGAIMAVQYSSPTIYGNTITQNHAVGGSIPGGGPSGGAIYLENDITNTSARVKPVIINNTITDNHAEHGGGAIMLRIGIDAIIEGNTITNNSAAFGGGIHIETEGSYPVVANNTIDNNTAPYDSKYSGSGYGGGIAVWNNSHPNITHNQIRGNSAMNGGGGISLAEQSYSTIQSNNIASNSVSGATTGSDAYFGGGIYVANASATLINNVVSSNSAGVGGGLATLDNAIVSFEHNTVASNTAVSTANPGAGGGIYIGNSAGSNVDIKDNIISANNNYQVYEAYAKATLTNNLITNDGKGLYFNWGSGGITSASVLDNSTKVNASATIASNPQFVVDGSQNGTSYSIAASSPARDVGNSNSVVREDYRRAIRPADSTKDIGAYEYTTDTVFKRPVYRFWSSQNHGHFYTQSAGERNAMIQSYPMQEWQYEFEAYDAFDAPVANSVPLYRFWSSTGRGHFFTADEAEKNYVLNNYSDKEWHYEGIAYYVYPSTYLGQSTDVYRFWGTTYQHHFYTADAGEMAYVRNTFPDAWLYEGPVFRIP